MSRNPRIDNRRSLHIISSHLILAIFSKEENDALANSIVYIKNTRNLLKCPKIDEYVSIKILNQFLELQKA